MFSKLIRCSSSQLYYWRDSSLVPGLRVSKEKQTKGYYSTVSEPSSLLGELVPFSKYKMFMVVANTHYEGPPSNTVEFTTKEGGEDHTHQIPKCLQIYLQIKEPEPISEEYGDVCLSPPTGLG